MYISYNLKRAKNNEIFNRETIEWKLETDEDIIELDDRINILLAKHISNLPVIKRYGIGYVGFMEVTGVIINKDDYTCELDEKHFIDYLKNSNILLNVPIFWNKETNYSIDELKSLKINSDDNETQNEDE